MRAFVLFISLLWLQSGWLSSSGELLTGGCLASLLWSLSAPHVFPRVMPQKNVELCCGSNRWSLKLCSFAPPKPHLRSLNYTNYWNHNEEAHHGFIAPSLSWCILISDWRPLEMWLRIWMSLVLAKESMLTPRAGKSRAINLGYNHNHTFTSTWRF